MRVVRSIAGSVVALGLVLAPAATLAGDAPLRVALDEGESVRLTMAVETETSTKMGEMAMPAQKSIVTTESEWRGAAAAEDGSRELTVHVHRVHGKVPTGMGPAIEFDSAEPDRVADNPMAGMMTVLAGRSMKVRASPDGTVKSVGGLGEARGDLDQLGADDPIAGAVGKSLLTDETLSQQFTGFLLRLPEGELEAGRKWKDEKVMAAGPMKIVTSSEYEITEVTDEAVAYRMTGSVRLGSGDDSGTADPMAAMMKNAKIEDAKISGTGRISRADGLPVESETVQSMSVDMQMGAAGGMSMQSRTVTRIRRAG